MSLTVDSPFVSVVLLRGCRTTQILVFLYVLSEKDPLNIRGGLTARILDNGE